MNSQPYWPSFAPSAGTVNRHAPPYERLAELNADLREAKARVRRVLEAVADKYDIPAKDVSYAIDGYADDMLSDLVFGIQRDLEHAAEAEAPGLGRHDRAPHRSERGRVVGAGAALPPDERVRPLRTGTGP